MDASEVLVIGAGLSGLLAARELQRAGRRVQVWDKGRGVGGRLATRRFEEGVRFDHGAQFFTVRSDRFRQVVDEWVAAGVAHEWCRGFRDASGAPHEDGHPRYSGLGGMSTLAKHLAKDLPIKTCVRAASVEQLPDGWLVRTDSGAEHRTNHLLLTPPVPQSLDLLARGHVTLPETIHGDLSALTYFPCAALMAMVEGTSPLPFPGAIQIPDGEPISWIADNGQKGATERLNSLTIHAGPEFTQRTWDSDADTVAAELIDAARPQIGEAKVITWQLHRWRYSRPVRQHPDRCLIVAGPPMLVFAGDAFGEPRVEGAALSGLAAADALKAG